MYERWRPEEIRLAGTQETIARKKKLDLDRVPAGGRTGGIILDEEPTLVWTHWFGGRTIPCTLESCPACEAGRKPRWTAYIQLFNPRTNRTFVTECTDNCRETIANYKSRHPSFRGAEARLKRDGTQKNGKLNITLFLPPTGISHLPSAIDLLEWLLNLWGAPDRQAKPLTPANGPYNAAVYAAEQAANGMVPSQSGDNQQPGD